MMAEVLIILRRSAWRHWRTAFRQQVVLAMILALGTGVYLAMRLANAAALAGFERFADGVTRQADWTLQGVAGPLPAGTLDRAREALGVRPVHLIPVVEATVTPATEEATRSIGSRPTWRLVGMDFIGLLNLREGAPAGLDARPPSDHGVLVTEGFAAKERARAGDRLRVVINERIETLIIGGLIPRVADLPEPPDHLILMDLPDADRFLGKRQTLDRIEVLVQPGGAFPKLAEETGNVLRQALGEGVRVLDHDSKRSLAATMTTAFRLNLTVLSLLALFVGGYLMFQALDGIVLRRRNEIGILKALGVRDRTIQVAFIVEALLLGSIGGAFGVLLGWLGAQGAVVAIARTMNALYGATSAHSASLRWDEAAFSLLLACVTSVIAAWWPAREAALTPPAQLMAREALALPRRSRRSLQIVVLLLLGAALALADLPPWRGSHGERWPIGGYLAALAWLFGASLGAGAVLPGLAFIGRALSAWSAQMRIAVSHLRRPSIRHRFAVSALTSAVAMTAGMTVMVASFDHTMRGWVERSMKADIYISSAGAQSASAMSMIPAETASLLRAQPDVAEVACLQAQPVMHEGGPFLVLGCDPDYVTRHDVYAWVERPAGAWWETDALINESFSERFGLRTGDTVVVPTRRGHERVRIAGIYADYGNERGSLTVPQARFREWFETDLAWRVAVMLRPGADAEAVRSRLQQAYPGLSIFTQAHLRAEALRIFRQTFSVTYALEVIGVVVAVAGLGLALASLLLERGEELRTLRSLGMSVREIAGASALEGLGVALTGTVTGLGTGLWLGWLLIYRINKQCFGWTLSLALPAWQLAALGAMVIAAGVIVSLLVSRRIVHEMD